MFEQADASHSCVSQAPRGASGYEIRKVIYSTNAVESVNSAFRRVFHARGHSPKTNPSRSSCASRCGRSRTGPCPSGSGGAPFPLHQFAIHFEGRLPVWRRAGRLHEESDRLVRLLVPQLMDVGSACLLPAVRFLPLSGLPRPCLGHEVSSRLGGATRRLPGRDLPTQDMRSFNVHRPPLARGSAPAR